MPTVRIMVWNVQNFGDAVPAKGNHVPLCNFIAYIVAQEDADILVMQELRMSGLAYLGQLNAALSNATTGGPGNWYYDYVRSALRVNPPQNSADTEWDLDHYEGYAVFWNHARSADFTLLNPEVNLSRGTLPFGAGLPAGVPAHAITLVYRGRDTAAGGGLGNNGWFQAPNFNPAAPNAASALYFCRSAARIHAADQLQVGPRLPCSFTINLDPANARYNVANPTRNLLPVTVYHATANKANTRINVQLSGYSRQLYQVYWPPGGPAVAGWYNADNGIIAGDFNIDASVDNADRSAYTVYTNIYTQGGASTGPALATMPGFRNSRATTVQLFNLHDRTPITGPAPAYFLKLPIDHFFYRIAVGRNFSGSVVDLFDMVTLGYPGLGPIIQSFWATIKAALGARQPNGTYANYPSRQAGSNTPAYVVAGANNTFQNVPIVGDLANWDNFRRGLTNSYFLQANGNNNTDDARTAAEFIKKLVSDHLPTVFRFDY
jgi:hypothetical protein